MSVACGFPIQPDGGGEMDEAQAEPGVTILPCRQRPTEEPGAIRSEEEGQREITQPIAP